VTVVVEAVVEKGAGMVQAWTAWFYSVALKRMGPPPRSRGRKYPLMQSGFRMQIWT
jgi:hypothetical protein